MENAVLDLRGVTCLDGRSLVEAMADDPSCAQLHVQRHPDTGVLTVMLRRDFQRTCDEKDAALDDVLDLPAGKFALHKKRVLEWREWARPLQPAFQRLIVGAYDHAERAQWTAVLRQNNPHDRIMRMCTQGKLRPIDFCCGALVIRVEARQKDLPRREYNQIRERLEDAAAEAISEAWDGQVPKELAAHCKWGACAKAVLHPSGIQRDAKSYEDVQSRAPTVDIVVAVTLPHTVLDVPSKQYTQPPFAVQWDAKTSGEQAARDKKVARVRRIVREHVDAMRVWLENQKKFRSLLRIAVPRSGRRMAEAWLAEYEFINSKHYALRINLTQDAWLRHYRVVLNAAGRPHKIGPRVVRETLSATPESNNLEKSFTLFHAYG